MKCKEVAGRFLHGAVMPNRIHLLVRTPESNLSNGMQHWLGGYANRYAKRNRRTGHLSQGRYKSFLGEDSSYFWTSFLQNGRYGIDEPDTTIWPGLPLEIVARVKCRGGRFAFGGVKIREQMQDFFHTQRVQQTVWHR